MAIVTGTNSSSPNAIQWATAGSDTFRRTHIAAAVENFDLHDHSAGRNLGVKRLQTTAVPAAAGEVRVNADDLNWYGTALQTGVRLAGTQTITGAKTFSAAVTVSAGGVSSTVANAAAFTALSGASGSRTHYAIGRTAEEGGLGVSAGAGQYLASSVAGDVVLSNTAGNLVLGCFGVNTIAFVTNNTTRWVMSGGSLIPQTDNSFDIGTSSGPFGIRTLYAGTSIFVGDNTNAQLTAGLTLNQGAADNEILSLKSSDVAHGVTTLTETDTYAAFDKASATAGGLRITALGSSSSPGFHARAIMATADATRATSATGAVYANGAKTNGTGVTTLGANGNLFVVADNGSARFLVDVEGDIHMDATSNINAWDDHDDAALLEAFRIRTADPPNYRRLFATDVEAHARVLAETGVVTFNEDGHHFVSVKALFGLLIDAVRQATAEARSSSARVGVLEARLSSGGD